MRLSENRVAYSVIEAAIKGDAEAIQLVIDHYDRYIKKLSVRKMVDEWGNERQVTDTHLCEILKVHLITAILKFNMRR